MRPATTYWRARMPAAVVSCITCYIRSQRRCRGQGTAPATTSEGEDGGEGLVECGGGIGGAGDGAPGDELIRPHQNRALFLDAPNCGPCAVRVLITVLRTDGG